MADNGAIIIRGSVLDVERKSGTSERGEWAFTIASVLTGKSVSEVRFSEQYEGTIPKEGDTIEVEVSLDVYKGRQQIEARRPVRAAGARVAAV